MSSILFLLIKKVYLKSVPSYPAVCPAAETVSHNPKSTHTLRPSRCHNFIRDDFAFFLNAVLVAEDAFQGPGQILCGQLLKRNDVKGTLQPGDDTSIVWLVQHHWTGNLRSTRP